MNKIFNTILCSIAVACCCSCADLDLNPLSEATSENWNSNVDEVKISLNDMYRAYLYDLERGYFTDRRSDDWAQRDKMYDIAEGSLSSSTSWIAETWNYTYKGISRCNRIEEALNTLSGNIPDAEVTAIRAEARFFRAYLYGRLISLWGDVPYYTKYITIDEARKMTRTNKKEILKHVYEDWDYAIANLPTDNSGSGTWRVTKGAALALKARLALTMEDWTIARDAAKDCMNLNVYSLYPDYGELFRQKKMTCETIFAIANSYSLGQSQNIKSWVLRTAGGTATAQPSWELLAAYECTDGLPIDESPLFNPKKPFENRDPRCTYTFVAPGTMTAYGTEFNPDPTVLNVISNGTSVRNKDCKTNDQYAAYNSCCLNKGAQPEWADGYNENPNIIIRYADVLLMYAEAKVELNEIDASVLNAINDVRARAYSAKRAETDKYPPVTTTDQNKLRLAIRRERRVEFAWEGRRLFDLMRWRWLDKAYSHDYYGHLNAQGIKDYAAKGNFFWPYAPEIDEYGFADFKPMYNDGYISKYGVRIFEERLYLWPLPFEEVDISDKKIEQNPGW